MRVNTTGLFGGEDGSGGCGRGGWRQSAEVVRTSPFYIGRAQYEAWKHTDLVIDVAPGRGGMFSLDNGRERRFLTRSTVCAAPPGGGGG